MRVPLKSGFYYCPKSIKMPVYKVWNVSRTSKKSVAAFTFDELVKKSGEKLGFPLVAEVVLEEDGTTIDETEVMLEFSGKTLIILQPGERWYPNNLQHMKVEPKDTSCSVSAADCIVPFAPAAVTAVPACIANTNSAPTSASTDYIIDCWYPSSFMKMEPEDKTYSATNAVTSALATSDSVLTNSPSLAVINSISDPGLAANCFTPSDALHLSSLRCKTSSSTTVPKYQERTIETLKNCSLPTFSAYVEENLTGVHPRPEIVWTRMISEAAHYYAARLKLETLRTAEQYRQIGMAMCKKYPAIALVGGTTPWFSFTKSFSQKIRHMRMELKNKSQGATQCMPRTAAASPSKRARSCSGPVAAMKRKPIFAAQDEEEHCKELLQEWQQSEKNTDHLKLLMRNTKKHRYQLIHSSSITEVLKHYPCLHDTAFIFHEFCEIFGEQAVADMTTRMSAFVKAAMTLAGIEESAASQVPSHCITMVMFLEKKTMWHQGRKSGGRQSILIVKNDISGDEIGDHLFTSAGDAPRLVCFYDEGQDLIEKLFVTADGVNFQLDPRSGIPTGLFYLMQFYYVFDLTYPRHYSMLLALLQTLVIGVKYKAQTSMGYRLLASQIMKKLE